MKQKIAVVLFSVMMFSSMYGQRNLKPEKVLENAVQALSDIRDFTVAIDISLNMERMQIPRMHATMYFKQPDKVHFDSQGFLFLPKEAIVLNPSILQERYTIASTSPDTIDGEKQYKLLLVAKEQTAHLLRLFCWINPSNWTISKIETTPYEGRTLTFKFSYVFEENKYWLLSKTVASFQSNTEKQSEPDLIEMKKQMIDETRMPAMRNGTVTIVYSDYKVNTGLDDSIFESKNTHKVSPDIGKSK